MATGFGIIGCGMIARFHAKAVADLRNARVVACYDTVPAAADKLAGRTRLPGLPRPGRDAGRPGGRTW